MKRFYFATVLTLACGLACAAGPSAVLTITPPTTNTDGTPITLPLTCNVYQGAKGAETLSQSAVPCSTVTVSTGLVDGSTECWQVTAVEGGQESAKSAEACKTFPAATPGAPSLSVQ